MYRIMTPCENWHLLQMLAVAMAVVVVYDWLCNTFRRM